MPRRRRLISTRLRGQASRVGRGGRAQETHRRRIFPARRRRRLPARWGCAFHIFFTNESRVRNSEALAEHRSCRLVEESLGNGDSAYGGNDGTLYAGELEIHPAEGLALATGRALTLSVREFELLVAMAKRIGTIVTREELYRVVWRRRAALRRPLGGRVRLQAAHQARSRDARPPLHPHPPRLRIPLPTPAFTKFSHIVLGSAVVGMLVGMTGADGGALMSPMFDPPLRGHPSTAISSVSDACVTRSLPSSRFFRGAFAGRRRRPGAQERR